ncbi:homoserine kinase [Arthrospiribacter ruber]|uniref:Homoserine kinase n=1 Tax=Arthrospiribacter ruber TaxID=2487934 RepID=A0A951IXA8_9BACT|nr:homoserine kinase [Arthrospiribacter ruber]MBW3468905.1 homoserine kinase [Arthrospiribacter ruber]
MKKVTAFAPATVANVSCGFDILGFAIDELGDKVSIMSNDSGRLEVKSISGDGGKLPMEADKNTCSVAIQAMLSHLGSDQGFDIVLEKGLPLGSGMGSSAASAAAALVAANELLGAPYSKEELVPFAMEAEKIACGAGHADNVAPSLMGGFVLIRDYYPLDLVKLPVPAGLHCTLLHPHLELKTSDSRSVLRKEISLKDSTVQSGNIAGLISGLFLGDFQLISRSLRDVIAEPSRALLIPGFYELREEIRSIGALGSGISGSGPTIFVLAPDKEIAIMAGKAAEDVFEKIGLEVDVYISEVNNKGAYLLEDQI